MKEYDAPWSRLLWATSITATLLCLGGAYTVAHVNGPAIVHAQGLLILGIMIGCALFTVRGYGITPHAIFVKRLYWDTRLPRTGLLSATVDVAATKGSIRTCGNGGFYSFTGWYRNKTLGNYRAFMTTCAGTVVLRYEKRTYVLSPGDPEGFVRDLGF
jgi:hypothetical protein